VQSTTFFGLLAQRAVRTWTASSSLSGGLDSPRHEVFLRSGASPVQALAQSDCGIDFLPEFMKFLDRLLL